MNELTDNDKVFNQDDKLRDNVNNALGLESLASLNYTSQHITLSSSSFTSSEKLISKSFDEKIIEQWLDQHPDFLVDYLATRRVDLHQIKARRAVCRHNSEPGDEEYEESEATENHSGRIKFFSGSQSDDELDTNQSENTGSVTPIRRISSKEFDAVSSVPILSICPHGSVTFIATADCSTCDSRRTLTFSPAQDRPRLGEPGGCGGIGSPLSSSSLPAGLAGLDSTVQPEVRRPRSWSLRKKPRRRSEVGSLDEREFMYEIILDVYNDLDVTHLAFKILQNVSLLIDADRCSLFLLQSNRRGEAVLVSKLFDVTADSQLEDSLIACGETRMEVPLGAGIMGTVAKTGDYLIIEDAYKDVRFNQEIDQLTGYRTRSILCMPLKDAAGEVLGVAQAVNKVLEPNESFSERDVKVFQLYLAFCGIGLRNAQIFEQSQLETRRNQVLLDLARVIFEEQSNLSRLIHKIMVHMAALLDCVCCQVILLESRHVPGAANHRNHSPFSSPSTPLPVSGRQTDIGSSAEHTGCTDCGPGEEEIVFSRMYSLSQSLAFSEENLKLRSAFTSKTNLNLVIPLIVVRNSETLNVTDLQTDPRFHSFSSITRSLAKINGDPVKAMLCTPIFNSKRSVIGVCQLINKTDSSASFTQSDQVLFEAFALFCGLGIHNAQVYERAIVSKAKQRVALEVLSYHAIATPEEAVELKKSLIPTVRYFKLADMDFSDFSLSDDDTLRACLRMFQEMNFVRHFRIDYLTLCRWLLSVKKNYRNVIYHNWRHAFNVAQLMFSIIQSIDLGDQLGPLQCLSLLIACLCHDLDHRGTNNQFQVKSMSPLAKLYSTSVLERHHFDQCVMILTTKGTDILAQCCSQEYSHILICIENAILATDLARYFSRRQAIHNLLGVTDISISLTSTTTADLSTSDTARIDWQDAQQVGLVRDLLMTACDLGAITKPWPVQHKIAQLVTREFFEQGDLEKYELNLVPQEMMDRDKKDQLPRLQIDFIDSICFPIYKALSRIAKPLETLLVGCLANRLEWKKLSESDSSSSIWNL